MSAPLALLLTCGAAALAAVLVLFVIAAYAAPRGITRGVLVSAARGMFVALLLLVVLALLAVAWGMLTGWSW